MKTYNLLEHGVRPDCTDLQTEAIQKVLDLCKQDGGKVVVPQGRFYTAALYLHSNTTLYLESGAELIGSDNCEDFAVFPVPDNVQMRSDMEMITLYYGRSWETYRRAIISAYGEKNIAIIGEAGSVIDGVHCYDPNGEEHYRGPHSIFLTCCENVLLQGYTAKHSGNFHHEANNCRDLVMRRVTCLGGSDGIHLHCTENALIEDCLFKTGDDCIAGTNIQNMTVRNCVLNTSCNLFRIGGIGIHIENCHAYGPGHYPHRMTVVQGKGKELPRQEGRHNTLAVVNYFASADYPFAASDIHFRNCIIENAEQILEYTANTPPIQIGAHWREFTLENVRFTGLRAASIPVADVTEPLTIRMKDVVVDFDESATDTQPFILQENAHTTLLREA